MKQAWWITTERLDRGGSKIAGPYDSRDEALKARVPIEEKAAGETYWVDSEPLAEVAVGD